MWLFYPLTEHRKSPLTQLLVSLVLCGCFSIKPQILLGSRNSPLIWNTFPQRLGMGHQAEKEGPQSLFDLTASVRAILVPSCKSTLMNCGILCKE